MKAAFIRRTGAPDVIEWGELPDPFVDDDDVLVKVSAVAVDPIDTYTRAGTFTPANPLPTPYVIGRDMVGIVEKVGGNVTTFQPGQRVWSNSLSVHTPQGCFSEYVAVPQHILYHAPDGVSDEQIAATVHSAATACLGIIYAGALKANEILFVHGAGGNVGGAVIQLAKARGSVVFCSTSSEEKKQWCQSLGADLVLDYKKDDIAKNIKERVPHGVNVFWDTSRNPDFDFSVSLLANKGRIILMAGADARPSFPVGPFYRKECTLKGFVLTYASTSQLADFALIINRCLQEGKLQAKIADVLPLKEAARAHAMMEAKPSVWGKIVLKLI